MEGGRRIEPAGLDTSSSAAGTEPVFGRLCCCWSESEGERERLRVVSESGMANSVHETMRFATSSGLAAGPVWNVGSRVWVGARRGEGLERAAGCKRRGESHTFRTLSACSGSCARHCPSAAQLQLAISVDAMRCRQTPSNIPRHQDSISVITTYEYLLTI
jgi:hypothetical protein